MRNTVPLLVFSLLLVSGSLFAQPGGWNADPEQRAAQQTATMTEKLALSEAQAAKIQEINLKYAHKMKEARDSAAGDREAMRATMGVLREEQDAELKTMLTDEQWQQWIAYREELRANRGNFGPGDRPAPPPRDSTGTSKKNRKKNPEEPNGQ